LSIAIDYLDGTHRRHQAIGKLRTLRHAVGFQYLDAKGQFWQLNASKLSGRNIDKFSIVNKKPASGPLFQQEATFGAGRDH
jgi:hypothetical protein